MVDTVALPVAETEPAGLPVVVVTVTYESAGVVGGLLDSLAAGMAGIDHWRCVVADNGSTDDSVRVVREHHPQARVLRLGANRGYAAGINAAVAAAGPHRAVLVVNPDVRLAPGAVATLLDVLETTGAGITVPLLSDARGERIHSLHREPSVRRALADALIGARRAGRIGTWGELVTADHPYVAGDDTDWAEGSTLLVGPRCWRDVGPWDESFFLYSEETDFGLRARDLGHPTRLVPAARAVHLEGGSATSPRLWPLVVANRLTLFARRHGRVATGAFWVALLLRETSRALIGNRAARAAVAVLTNPRRLREERGPAWLR